MRKLNGWFAVAGALALMLLGGPSPAGAQCNQCYTCPGPSEDYPHQKGSGGLSLGRHDLDHSSCGTCPGCLIVDTNCPPHNSCVGDDLEEMGGLKSLVIAVRSNDRSTMVKFLSVRESVVLNRSRQAIQLTNCEGDGIGAHVQLTAVQYADLDAYMGRLDVRASMALHDVLRFASRARKMGWDVTMVMALVGWGGLFI